MEPSRGSTLAWRNLNASAAAVFSTPLGWMSLVMCDNVLLRLSFGHRAAAAAAAATGLNDADRIASTDSDTAALVERLTRYAAGAFDDFLDIEVETSHLSPFAASVVNAVRRIPFGETRSYGELAVSVGRPLAARAVGGVMARNRTPLVVPCHRVLGSGGALGGFSAIDGVRMKRRLLELEAAAVAPVP